MKNDNDFMHGMFDFNRDGKTSYTEMFIAHTIWEECSKPSASKSRGKISSVQPQAPQKKHFPKRLSEEAHKQYVEAEKKTIRCLSVSITVIAVMIFALIIILIAKAMSADHEVAAFLLIFALAEFIAVIAALCIYSKDISEHRHYIEIYDEIYRQTCKEKEKKAAAQSDTPQADITAATHE